MFEEAIKWALSQEITDMDGAVRRVTADMRGNLVEKVREYFNKNNIAYDTFSYSDLEPLLM